MHPWAARWHFVRTPLAIVDLLSTIPLYIVLFADVDLRGALILRIAALLQACAIFARMRSLAAAMQAERNALSPPACC